MNYSFTAQFLGNQREEVVQFGHRRGMLRASARLQVRRRCASAGCAGCCAAGGGAVQVEPANMRCCRESCTEGGLGIVMENEAPVGEVPVSSGTSVL